MAVSFPGPVAILVLLTSTSGPHVSKQMQLNVKGLGKHAQHAVALWQCW